MSYQYLLLDVAEGIATVTMNRPSAMNAMTSAAINDLGKMVGELAESPEVRVVIITGAGEKAFVAGGDIADLKELDPSGARKMALLAHGVFKAIEESPKPFIAAVNGYALGGGCELAMSCDIRIASESARFGQPEVNIGIIPGFGGTQRLPRLVGKGRALEMILTGEMIDANEALRIGLVNKVVPPSELMPSARSMAAKIASKGMVSIRLCKEAVLNGLEMDLGRASLYEADLFALSFTTDDQEEGMGAFLEKRSPRFQDR